MGASISIHGVESIKVFRTTYRGEPFENFDMIRLKLTTKLGNVEIFLYGDVGLNIETPVTEKEVKHSED